MDTQTEKTVYSSNLVNFFHLAHKNTTLCSSQKKGGRFVANLGILVHLVQWEHVIFSQVTRCSRKCRKNPLLCTAGNLQNHLSYAQQANFREVSQEFLPVRIFKHWISRILQCVRQQPAYSSIWGTGLYLESKNTIERKEKVKKR